jgi:cell wall-associated NlpC family hydrolase
MAYPTIRAGQTSSAVAAMQAGLHRALAEAGLPHKNKSNGAYGANTVDDAARFKRKYVSPTGAVSGKTFSEKDWKALEKWLGKYDKSRIASYQADVEKAAALKKAALELEYPVVKAGQTNSAVAAMQAGLHRALKDAKLPHGNKSNGAYGKNTIEDVCRFKRKFVTPSGAVNGRYFGLDAWRALQPWLGKYDRYRIDKQLKAEAKAKAKAAAALKKATEKVALYVTIAAVALKLYAARANYLYVQYRPMPGCLFCTKAYRRLDCSSTATEVYHEAGAPDPNGTNYNGYGYTGTLWNHGTYVSEPRAGDLAFYGNMGNGIPSHVAIHVSATAVVSFGSNPIRHLYYRYRGDYRGSRRYV